MSEVTENISEQTQTQTQTQDEKATMIEVPLDLLSNLRNIIEVVNSRGFTWKTEELLPVGLIVKQSDDILEKYKKEDEKTPSN